MMRDIVRPSFDADERMIQDVRTVRKLCHSVARPDDGEVLDHIHDVILDREQRNEDFAAMEQLFWHRKIFL